MISESVWAREENARRSIKWLVTGYVLNGVALAVLYTIMGNRYLAVQSLGTIAALGSIFGLFHLLRIKPVYSLYTVIVGFTYAAYTLGVACALYKTLPGYDKLLHMLSGTLTMMLALPLFYVLKSGHRIESGDYRLAAVFCLSVALAVAGVWEIAEFFLSSVSSLDPQCVQATGVTDTMQDMIVCTVGAMVALPSMRRFYRTGEGGFLYGPVGVFIERNLTDE